jgi:alginate O-acetyltransferase complex protein AlgI
VLAYVRYRLPASVFALSGAVVVVAHAVAYFVDVARGQATARQPLLSALYLLQFPLFPAGPLVRFRDFAANLPKLATVAGLGSFTYGVRRVIIGWVKVDLVAGVLAGPVDSVFALPPGRLSAGVAWLAAICAALELYYRFSGYADFAIGIGRMLGFRYPENFRRPYTADSIREFWRRWSVTTITWLRDYVSLPIAGRDVPTPGLFANIVVGFIVIGLWHGGGSTTIAWAIYSATWLALEALWLSPMIERLPRVLRHVYVLLIVVVGWVVLRSPAVAPLMNVLQAMAGFADGGRLAYQASRYLDWSVGTALVVAIVGAGPLVPWISRWRVTLDATTAAAVMMFSAFWLFVWRPAAMAREALWPRPPRR